MTEYQILKRATEITATLNGNTVIPNKKGWQWQRKRMRWGPNGEDRFGIPVNNR